ncbi:hypothetical protein AALB81_06965 [Lachnospiraceae bacterium 48-33]
MVLILMVIMEFLLIQIMTGVFMQLDQNLGSKYGWFGLHGCSKLENGLSVKTIGYPKDKTSYDQWNAHGIISRVNGNIMEYSSYTVGGNSGGPVLNNGCVYGIHSCSYYTNSGVRTCAGATCMYDEYNI